MSPLPAARRRIFGPARVGSHTGAGPGAGAGSCAGAGPRVGVAVAILAALVAGLLAGLASPASAQAGDIGDLDEADRIVEILPLEGYLDPPAAGAIVDTIALANERGSELVVVQISTDGAISADLDELVDTIRSSEVPVAVFVGPQGAQATAGGGGALLLLSAQIAAVAPDATVGPADPFDLGDGHDPATTTTRLAALIADRSGSATSDGDGQAADDPEAEGRAADLAQQLATNPVDADTLVQAGLVDLTAAGLEPLLVELDGRTVTTAAGPTTLRIRTDEVGVRFHSLGLVRRALHAATTPVWIYLMLTAGIAMLLFEVFQPGFGVAGFAGVVTVAIAAFGVAVLPVSWWALLLVVLGLVLYAVDVAIAGFGAVTLAATVTFALGSLNFYDSEVIGLNGWVVGLNAVAALIFFVGVMTVVLRAQAGPETEAVGELVGKAGVVRSVLNPEGHVYIDGALWRARWTGDGKRAKVGTPVKVHGLDGALVLVDRYDPAERATADADRAAARSDGAAAGSDGAAAGSDGVDTPVDASG